MLIIANLAILLLLSWFLYKHCFNYWSGIRRFLLALTVSVHIYFLFSSVSYFLCLNFSVSTVSRENTELIILALISALSAALILTGSQGSHSGSDYSPLSSDTDWIGSLPIQISPKVIVGVKFLTGLSVLIVLIYAVSKLYSDPHGEWDAWAIWNLKARFLYRSPYEWSTGFSQVIAWSHPDYPLLIPILIAKHWGLFGQESVVVPHIIAAFYLISGAYVMYCVISKFVDSNVACLTLLLLFSSYAYIRNSVFLTADIPLANLLLLSVCFFCSYLVLKQTFMLMLAYLFLGAVIWAKNEGQLIYIIFAVFYLVQSYKSAGLQRSLMLAVLTLLPFILCYLIFKQQISSANDLFANNSVQAVLDRSLDLSRYKLVASSFLGAIVDLFKINLLFVIALLICFRKQIIYSDVSYLLIAILASVFGYLAIYLFITPHDLAWHLQTSMQRIMLHFYPSFVFLLFFATKKVS